VDELQQATLIREERETFDGRDFSIYASIPQSEPATYISGIVYKDEDNDGIYYAKTDIAISGAIVSAWQGDELMAVNYTDGEGRYSLSVPAGTGYTLKVSLPQEDECYSPEFKRWGLWSTMEASVKDVRCPSHNQDLSVNYQMLNYGPKNFSWELWHKGPVSDNRNVILVHGFRFPGSAKRGRCDEQFKKLDDLLQTKEEQYNAWQFEYADSSRGTLDTVATYASRLGEAVNKVSSLTGLNTCSIIGYSMGGIIARKYIANGGKGRVDKLLTLATPNMGTLRFEPFNLRWPDKMVPRAGAELRPDSRLLWDLNAKLDSSTMPEFAALGGYSWGPTDGVIEMSSTSLAKFNPDGSITQNLYFAGVKRSHLNINQIRNKRDEVFQLIRSFLRGGIAGISSMRPAQEPRDRNVHFFLTFALKEKPKRRMAYPSVVVENTNRRYSGFKVLSQGARTEDGSHIFTVQLKPDDDGRVRIYYAQDKYETVQIHKGQATLATKPIGAGPEEKSKNSIKTILSGKAKVQSEVAPA